MAFTRGVPVAVSAAATVASSVENNSQCVAVACAGPPLEESAPKRPRLDTFVLQPEEDFLQQYSGPSKVGQAVRGRPGGGDMQQYSRRRKVEDKPC